MNKEFPLFPDLPEEAQYEAQELIETFKEKLKEEAAEVIGKFYTDVVLYIMSDSWTNFRNELMDGFKNYNNSKIQGQYDFKKIREKIYEDYKDEIIKDLNQDNLYIIDKQEREIKRLEKENTSYQNQLRRY